MKHTNAVSKIASNNFNIDVSGSWTFISKDINTCQRVSMALSFSILCRNINLSYLWIIQTPLIKCLIKHITSKQAQACDFRLGCTNGPRSSFVPCTN